MKEAEVSWKKSRPEPSSADEEYLERYDEQLKIGRRDDDRLVVTIDQFGELVGADLTYAWSPIDERPTVDLSVSHGGLNFLGGLAENGETLFLECAGSFNKEATFSFSKHFRQSSKRSSLWFSTRVHISRPRKSSNLPGNRS